MSVYVDRLVTYPHGKVSPSASKHGQVWCHLWADTEDELHAFAEKLGLKREWFQPHTLAGHYDLTPDMRKKALALGAVKYSMHSWLMKRRKLL